MPNKTNISESQIVQFILQALIFGLPFTGIILDPAQVQALAGIAGTIAFFAWSQRQRQKKFEVKKSD